MNSDKGYSYEMLRIYVGHKLVYMGFKNARVTVLTALTDSVENYIKTVATSSKRCDHILVHIQPNLLTLINALKKIGLQMDTLIECCIRIDMKWYTKVEFLVNEKTPKEGVDFFGLQTTFWKNRKILAGRKQCVVCATVEEYLQSEQVCITAERDLENMFYIKPLFKPRRIFQNQT